MYKKRTSIVSLLCSIAVALLIFACADDSGNNGGGGNDIGVTLALNGEAGTTSATVDVTATHDATLHWVLYAARTTKDDATTVINEAADDSSAGVARSGTAGVSVDANQARQITISPISPATTYALYAVITVNNTSVLSSALPFTTASAATVYDYMCDNGTKADGTTDTEGTTNCKSCDDYYKLAEIADTNRYSCVPTIYTCTNGTADTTSTPQDDTPEVDDKNADIQNCASCTSDGDIVHEGACETFAISSAPTSTATSSGANITATASHDATLHWVVYADGTSKTDAATVYNEAQDSSTVTVVARSGSTGVSLTGGESKQFFIGGPLDAELDAETDYTAYVVITATGSNTVRVLSSDIDFTTLAAGTPGFSAQPATNNLQKTSTGIIFTTDEMTDLYWVLASSQQSYTTAELKAAATGSVSGDIVAVSGSGVDTEPANMQTTISLPNLTPKTTYFFYALLEDTDENQTASNELSFETAGIAYKCDNGTAVDGTATTEMNNCASCNDYYKLNDNSCVATEYTCSNGAKATDSPNKTNDPTLEGTPAANMDVEKCTACNDFFKLNGDTCEATVYTCAGGTKATGSPDATNDSTLVGTPAANMDVEKCTDCDPGFTKDGDSCNAALLGIWEIDDNDTFDAPSACFVTFQSDGSVVWNGACTDYSPIDSYDTYEVDGNSLIFNKSSGQGHGIQHDFTIDYEDSTGVFTMNPHSTTLTGNRYLREYTAVDLLGIWEIDDDVNFDATSACLVTFLSDESVAWNGACTDYSPIDSYDTYEADDVSLIFNKSSGQGHGIQHDFTIDYDDSTGVITINPHSSTLTGNHYLRAYSGLVFTESTAISQTAATVTVTPSHGGTLYWIAYADNDPAPAPADLISNAKAGTGGLVQGADTGITVTALTDTAIEISGLTQNTGYDIYMALEADIDDTTAQILSEKIDVMTPSSGKPSFTHQPMDTDILLDGATITLTADKGAKLYWVVYDTAQAPLTAADLKTAAVGSTAGVDRSGNTETVAAHTAKTVSVTNLVPETPYYFYALLEDNDEATMQTLSTALSFTTAGCDAGYGSQNNGGGYECVLELVGLWQFDTDNTCSTNSCYVAMVDGTVSWHGDCPADVAPTTTIAYTVQPDRVAYDGQDYIVEQTGANFQLNPQSNSFTNTNRYLCPRTGFTPITARTIAHTSAELSIASSSSGTAYWIVYADDATAPTTADELITAAKGGTAGVARSAAAGIDASTVFEAFAISITGLTQNTSYDLYVAFDDGTPQLLDKYDLTTACPAGEHGGETADGMCELNQYICTNGQAAVASNTDDSPPTHNNVEKCTMCTGDYVMDSNGVCSFLVVEHVDDMNNVIGRTLTCDLAAVGATAMVDLDGDDTVYDGAVAYTKRSTPQDFSAIRSMAATTCTSGITDMSSLFAVQNFNADITHWDTSSVTDMSSMFAKNDDFSQDISFWDTSNVTNMSSMFLGRNGNGSAGNTPIVSRWNTSKVTNMESMFKENGNFNGDISGWDVSSVTTMEGMFRVAKAFNTDISDWDVRNVTRAGMKNMFRTAAAFRQDISDWCVKDIDQKPDSFDTDTSDSDWPDSSQPQWGSTTSANCS